MFMCPKHLGKRGAPWYGGHYSALGGLQFESSYQYFQFYRASGLDTLVGKNGHKQKEILVNAETLKAHKDFSSVRPQYKQNKKHVSWTSM
jgi:hypothetical protein